MSSHTRVLRVESDLVLHAADQNPALGQRFDYAPPATVWRRAESLARLSVHLALQAKRLEEQCDVVWAGNEHVGIPLSFMRLRKPLVVVAHHMESRARATLAQLTGVVRRWDGIGYVSDEGKRFFLDYFHVPATRLFQYESAKYLSRAGPSGHTSTGPIVSVGVARRDYPTLVAALTELRGYDTEIHATSKFGDTLGRDFPTSLPAWVQAGGWLGEEELLQRYARARFVVVPLRRTTHSSAGVNAALEAAAFGKAVIASRTGGMATFVKDGETGLLVPPHDVSALREAIRSLWSDPAVAHRLGMAARRYVEQRFNPEVIDTNIIAFLDRLCAGACHR